MHINPKRSCVFSPAEGWVGSCWFMSEATFLCQVWLRLCSLHADSLEHPLGALCVTRDHTTLHVLPLGSGHLLVSGRGSLCFSLPENSVLPSYWHSLCFYVDLEAVPSAAAGEAPETALSGSLRSLCHAGHAGGTLGPIWGSHSPPPQPCSGDTAWLAPSPLSASVLSSRVCGAAGGTCHLLRLQSPGQQPLRSLRAVSLFSVPLFVVGPLHLWVAAVLRSLDPCTDQGSWVHPPASGLPCETGHCWSLSQLGSPPALLWTSIRSFHRQ